MGIRVLLDAAFIHRIINMLTRTDDPANVHPIAANFPSAWPERRTEIWPCALRIACNGKLILPAPRLGETPYYDAYQRSPTFWALEIVPMGKIILPGSPHGHCEYTGQPKLICKPVMQNRMARADKHGVSEKTAGLSQFASAWGLGGQRGSSPFDSVPPNLVHNLTSVLGLKFEPRSY
jgi:hypothetical protein